MDEKSSATERVAEIDERLRNIEAGDSTASDTEVDELTQERERLLNKVDDEL